MIFVDHSQGSDPKLTEALTHSMSGSNPIPGRAVIAYAPVCWYSSESRWKRVVWLSDI